jgi:hypothetical protein
MCIKVNELAGTYHTRNAQGISLSHEIDAESLPRAFVEIIYTLYIVHINIIFRLVRNLI